jgi:hypothetical protein
MIAYWPPNRSKSKPHMPAHGRNCKFALKIPADKKRQEDCMKHLDQKLDWAKLPPSFRRIRLELAREKGHPQGSARIGYTFVAPLDANGKIDADLWHRTPIVFWLRGRTPAKRAVRFSNPFLCCAGAKGQSLRRSTKITILTLPIAASKMLSLGLSVTG